jgi:hypothetical protein
MNGKIRRVITGHDASGKAIVIEDGLAPAVRTNPLRRGHDLLIALKRRQIRNL